MRWVHVAMAFDGSSERTVYDKAEELRPVTSNGNRRAAAFIIE
jgi:hypothetical protein